MRSYIQKIIKWFSKRKKLCNQIGYINLALFLIVAVLIFCLMIADLQNGRIKNQSLPTYMTGVANLLLVLGAIFLVLGGDEGRGNRKNFEPPIGPNSHLSIDDLLKDIFKREKVSPR